MPSPIGRGGGVQFIPGNAASQIGKQLQGVLHNMMLPESNQLNDRIIQEQPILSSGFQQFFVKADNVIHVDSGVEASAFSKGRHFGNAAFNKDSQTISQSVGKSTELFMGK